MVQLPEGPFGCVYADPAWPFRTYSGKTSVPTQAADPYPTMSMSDMMSIPVASVAARDAALFMWVVGAHIPDALALASAWGFAFKTDAFVWVKSESLNYGLFDPQFAFGMGYWTRKQSETCLLFTRGKPKRLHADVRQIIDTPRREHSRKPEEAYGRIERLVGGPYLELFARTARPGWSSWGNEIDKFAP